MVTNLSDTHSIVCRWVRELRDKDIQTDRERFRKNLERLGEVCAYEISKTLQYEAVTVQTPLGEAQCMEPERPVLATILRAGLPLHQGLLNYFGDADCAFIGAYRKHDAEGNFVINRQYMTTPAMDGRTLIVADPMLATGASITEVLNALLAAGLPRHIHVVAAIAYEGGIKYVLDHFPGIDIWVGAIDKDITAEKYIYPGLGDAGDLSFGEKQQM